MKIEDRLIKLAIERKALINKVAQVAEDMRNIPTSKHVKLDYSIVDINDLSVEEQSKIIRFSDKAR